MKIKKEVKVGIITVVAIACFIYGFNFLKGKNFFVNQRTYYAVYKNIDGLVEANPLMINGYKVGLVGEIKLRRDTATSVIVALLLDIDIQVPKNSIAKVISSDLLGSKAVDLILGKSMEYAKSGDTLESAQEDNLKESVNKTIAPLKKKAEGLIASIDSVMITVQQVFNESARENLAKTFEKIKTTITSLETTSYRLDTLVANEKMKISNILTKINIIATTLANNTDKLNNVIGNFSNISDSLAKSNIKSTINNANTAIAEASSVLTKINTGQGTMGKLVNNDSLYIKLDKAAEELDKLLKDVRLNPNRYINLRNKRKPYKD